MPVYLTPYFFFSTLAAFLFFPTFFSKIWKTFLIEPLQQPSLDTIIFMDYSIVFGLLHLKYLLWHFILHYLIWPAMSYLFFGHLAFLMTHRTDYFFFYLNYMECICYKGRKTGLSNFWIFYYCHSSIKREDENYYWLNTYHNQLLEFLIFCDESAYKS